MKDDLLCKIPTLEEFNRKWDYETTRRKGDKRNWLIWKQEAAENFQVGKTIPYYGILKGHIICEATAMLDPETIQNSDGLVGAHTAYLCAFRTLPEFQGKGYFGVLFRYMLHDLKEKGYTKVTLGVEPTEKRNKQIYAHYGFTEHIKSAAETYPDGTVIQVDYYGMYI